MDRRTFTKSSIWASLGLAVAPRVMAGQNNFNKHQFNLKYAPHIGMFNNLAGDDPIDQLNFMADQGFTAFEDNNMGTRPISLQEKMSLTMQKRGLEMGVFVGYKDFKNPTLAGGKEEARRDFLKQIKTSVEVAKRVNAKWFTVVPGTVDLRLVEGYQTANVVESLKQVDNIIKQETLDYTSNLLNIKPDFVVHGDDWISGPQKETREKVIKTINEWGGQVIDVPYTTGISTTDIINRIK